MWWGYKENYVANPKTLPHLVSWVLRKVTKPSLRHQSVLDEFRIHPIDARLDEVAGAYRVGHVTYFGNIATFVMSTSSVVRIKYGALSGSTTQ